MLYRQSAAVNIVINLLTVIILWFPMVDTIVFIRTDSSGFRYPFLSEKKMCDRLEIGHPLQCLGVGCALLMHQIMSVML